FVTGPHVQLVVSCVIDTAEIPHLAAVRTAAVVAVIADGAAVTPRHTERYVHTFIGLVIILVAVSGHGNAHIADTAQVEVVREHDVVVGLFVAIPVGMAGVVEINRHTGIPEVLVIGGGVHLFVVAGAHHFA